MLNQQPEQISTIFSRKPSELTDSDIDKIVTELRAKRATFNAEPVKRVKKEIVPAAQLDDLLKGIL